MLGILRHPRRAFLAAAVAVLAAFVLLAVQSGRAQATTYSFTTIVVPGVAFASASGINAAGQIVGSYLNTSSVRHGFLDSGGSFSTIDAPNALPETTRPIGINDGVRSWGGTTTPPSAIWAF
jgi:hypothetical protein